MMRFDSIEGIVSMAEETGKSISGLVLEYQASEMDCGKEELYKRMAENLGVMKEAVNEGLKPGLRSVSGLTGGDALKLSEAVLKGRTLGDGMLESVLIKALAVAGINACMGRVVAAPTAGSCGIIPAVLLTVAEKGNMPEEKAVMGLFAAAGIGMVIAKQASISGAEGGCQAECGSASAMAAAAAVEMAGGTPRMSANACAIALKNVLGLVCDPVAGLVEVPCIKRNAMGAANALVAAELALAGIESAIPADEVVAAMGSIGRLMSASLKETAEGGLAATPTGKRLAAEIFGSKK